jgi:hypothetical protein
MIKNILELLELAQGETENIRIAKGKYYFPKTFSEIYKHQKKIYKWQ